MIELLGWFDGRALLALTACGCLLGLRLLRTPTTEGNSMAKLRPVPCQAKGCAGWRSHRHPVCPACWKRVPKHLRSDVYRTWDQFQAGAPDGYLRWLSARHKCLESLQ